MNYFYGLLLKDIQKRVIDAIDKDIDKKIDKRIKQKFCEVPFI